MHFQFGFHVSPDRSVEALASYGYSFAIYWAEAPTLREALVRALDAVEAEGWKITEVEYGCEVDREAIEQDEELLPCFREAEETGSFLQLRTSPRFCLFAVEMQVIQAREIAQAVFFVSADALAGEGEDLFREDYWSESKRERALSEAEFKVERSGWQVNGS